MALHRLTTITLGVPAVAPVARYYDEFDLTPLGDARFATVDAGEQLRLVATPTRRLFELGVGADDPDDLARIAAALARLDVPVTRTDDALVTVEPGTAVRVVVRPAPRLRQPRIAASPTNAAGRCDRPTRRADASCVRRRSGRGSSATWWSAPPISRGASASSWRASASR